MIYIYIAIIAIVIIMSFSIKFVSSNNIYLVERFGRYNRRLNPGVNIVIPLIERIVYMYPQNSSLSYCRNGFEIYVEYDVAKIEDTYYQFGDINQFIHSLINGYIDRLDTNNNKDSKENIKRLINETLENTGITINSLELTQEKK